MMQESESSNGPKEIHDGCKGFGALSVDNVVHCTVVTEETCMPTLPE